MLTRRKILSASAGLALVGCATRTKVAQAKPSVRTISIIPATNPSWYTLNNVSAVQFVVPIAATFNHLDSKEKAKLFNERMKAQESSLASDFNEGVARLLKQYGYEVDTLDGIARDPDSPDYVDYDRVVTTADAMLHLRFTEVGLYSPRSSLNYIPRVDAYGSLIVKGREEYLYDQEIYYGIDARKGTAWSIDADEKFAYPSFDDVLAKLDDVRKAFGAGATAISARMADQIRDTLRRPG